MREVVRRSGSGYYELIDELGLTLNQLRTLQVLECEGPDLSLKELAARTRSSLAATSRNVEQLLRRGLLARREDTQDRRVRRVRLTEQGAQTLERIDAARLAGLEAFAATLRPRQRARLHSALSDLTAPGEERAA